MKLFDLIFEDLVENIIGLIAYLIYVKYTYMLLWS